MWAFVMALFSIFSVTIKNFVVDHLHLVIAWFIRFLSGPIKIFVLNHLKLVVLTLFTFFSFQIKNFLWDHRYILLVGSNVKALTRELDILKKKLMDVQKEIEMDEASMKKPTEEVEGWMKRVQALLPSVESVVTDYGNRSYFSNVYSISIQAVDQLKEVRKEAEFIKSVRAYTTAARPPSVQMISALPIEFGREMFESRLLEAVNFLRDDKQGVLGIWGMGGVGKTTLVEHINNTLAKNPASFGFNKVVLVTASRECTTEKIQSQIVNKLGLSGGETNSIFNYLNNKSFAILLDDLWEDVELKEVGIPLPLGMVGDYKRKLILTTRFERVCYNMGAREPALFKLDCLGTQDARHLFRSRVGEEVIRSDMTIPKLADKVADLCGGLPIALNAVGRAMAGARDVNVWENAVDELKESKSKFFETREEIAGTKHNPLPLLKFSYDQLKDSKKKECLLHCALWPEDYRIPKDELIQCWMGHGLLGEFNTNLQAYRKGHAMIESLRKTSLLEHAEYGYSELKDDYVKLHDLIRDMALWIACDCGVNKNKWTVLARQGMREVNKSKWTAFARQGPKEAPRDKKLWREAHKISLMFNSIKSLPSEIHNSPNLTTLMLQENIYLVDGGLRVTKYFNSLKYLDISRCISLKCFPAEICGLTKLEYLNISNTFIRSIPEELKDLVNMKYLIARNVPLNSRVTPELLSNLVNLIELDLFRTGDREFGSSVIDNLDCLEGRLKGLGITMTTFSNLQKIVQLSGIPISSLYLEGMEGLDSSLELLSHDFLGSQHIRSNLKKLFLSHCTSVEEVVVEGKHQLNIERLCLDGATGLKEIKWKQVEPRDVLQKLRLLEIYKCYALKSIEWVMYLPCLEHLILLECLEMEQMFREEAGAAGTMQEEDDRPTFPSLRYLYLSHMPKLSSICHRSLTFPSLEKLGFVRCEQLKKLPCLEFLDLRMCLEMEQMFGKEAGAARTKQEEEDMPTFPSLRNLTFYNLPKLSSICHRSLTFPSLELLYINNCPQLKKLPFHSHSSCTKLREICCDEATWNVIDLEDMVATLEASPHDLLTMQRGAFMSRHHHNFIPWSWIPMLLQLRELTQRQIPCAKEMLEHLESVLANEPASVKPGQYIVEVKPQGVSKGVVAEKILSSLVEGGRQADFVLCVGDDRSDEDMFRSLYPYPNFAFIPYQDRTRALPAP